MTVRVETIAGDVINFDNGDDWQLSDSVVGPRLDVIKKNGTETKIVGSFAPGQWESVRLVAKEDKAALLAEAVELVKDVDDGNFGHQSTEWQDRAEKFLEAVQ